MPILDIVSKFNQQADSHSKSQSLNPFSDQFEQSRSPSPRFSREEYGKWVRDEFDNFFFEKQN